MSARPIDLFGARLARDAGMAQAIERAARVDDEWPETAYAFLCRYARAHATFISEEATTEADRLGYGSPTDPRAWGAVFKNAARDGVIRKIGYGISQRRHLSPTPLWESRVFAGSAA